MSKLSVNDVTKLARLARLRLSVAEVDRFVGELSAILEYVELLNNADIRGLKPTQQVTGLTNVMRPDVVDSKQLSRDELLKNVPNTHDGLIKVRRMVG